MKLVNYYVEGEITLGIVGEKGIIDVKKTANRQNKLVPLSMGEVISSGAQGIKQLKSLLDEESSFIFEENIQFAPCVDKPEKIICVGLNYVNHAKESNMEIPDFPILFSKFNNALAAHRQVIAIPETAKQIDYEAEMVMVVGKEARNVTQEEALSCVFGYTVGNDVSARDFQFRTGQWLLGKTCDGFAPIGPYVVTADEIDPTNLRIECKINGQIKQSANTADMIFDCATLVSYISQHMTLKPGDLIFTGTPDGVILGEQENNRHWLKSGDVMEVTIEQIGTLKNELK
ncbi:MAG: fumarylacetoacetate hydrolase family protein [Bacillus sp. (in: firmicutes)]